MKQKQKARRVCCTAEAEPSGLQSITLWVSAAVLCVTAKLGARLPLWVNNGHPDKLKECPLFPHSGHWDSAAKCPLCAKSGHWRGCPIIYPAVASSERPTNGCRCAVDAQPGLRSTARHNQTIFASSGTNIAAPIPRKITASITKKPRSHPITACSQEQREGAILAARMTTTLNGVQTNATSKARGSYKCPRPNPAMTPTTRNEPSPNRNPRFMS
jgi:hypothetical protein